MGDVVERYKHLALRMPVSAMEPIEQIVSMRRERTASSFSRSALIAELIKVATPIVLKEELERRNSLKNEY